MAVKWARWLTWICWTFNLIICGVYSAAAIWTFRILLKASDWSSKDGLLASCILGTVIVDAWVIISFVVLLSHAWGKTPVCYGFMLGTALHTGVFQLLAGLMLNASRSTIASMSRGVDSAYDKLDYKVYVATYVLSYILCGTYVTLFVILLLTRPFIASPDKGEEKALRANVYQNRGDSVSTQKTTAPPLSAVVPAPSEASTSSSWTSAFRSKKAAPPSIPENASASLPVSQPAVRTTLSYSADSYSSTKSKFGMGPSKYGAYNV